MPPTIDTTAGINGAVLVVPKGNLNAYLNSDWASVSNYITEED